MLIEVAKGFVTNPLTKRAGEVLWEEAKKTYCRSPHRPTVGRLDDLQ